MFRLLDDTAETTLLVDAIHDDAGYRAIRRSLARSYDPAKRDAEATLRHVAELWGYKVRLQEIDVDTEAVLATHAGKPPAS